MEKSLTLYEYLRLGQGDYDTYDTVYDAVVTVCYIDEEDVSDAYDKFCVEIAKKVDVVGVANDCELTVNWNDLIVRNMEKVKAFTKKYWKNQYEDDEDELVYQWINEIHMYLAGYVSESFYKTLLEFLNTLE